MTTAIATTQHVSNIRIRRTLRSHKCTSYYDNTCVDPLGTLPSIPSSCPGSASPAPGTSPHSTPSLLPTVADSPSSDPPQANVVDLEYRALAWWSCLLGAGNATRTNHQYCCRKRWGAMGEGPEWQVCSAGRNHGVPQCEKPH